MTQAPPGTWPTETQQKTCTEFVLEFSTQSWFSVKINASCLWPAAATYDSSGIWVRGGAGPPPPPTHTHTHTNTHQTLGHDLLREPHHVAQGRARLQRGRHFARPRPAQGVEGRGHRAEDLLDTADGRAVLQAQHRPARACVICCFDCRTLLNAPNTSSKQVDGGVRHSRHSTGACMCAFERVR